jgi:hypothetical protein
MHKPETALNNKTHETFLYLASPWVKADIPDRLADVR